MRQLQRSTRRLQATARLRLCSMSCAVLAPCLGRNVRRLAIMKALSWSFIVTPTLLLPLAIMPVDWRLASVLAWSWILSSIGCLIWGLCIQRRCRGLARLCFWVGFLHVMLLILLPFFATAKTRSSFEGSKPNFCLRGCADCTALCVGASSVAHRSALR